MVDIFNNKTAFLNLAPKRLFLLVVFLGILLIILFAILIKIEVYEHYLTKGYVMCKQNCYVISYIPPNIEVDKILMNQKEIDFTIHDKILKIKEDKMLSYYKLTFTCGEKLENDQIVNLNFYYNKQSILNKLIEKKD